jgi:hypothetical protein
MDAGKRLSVTRAFFFRFAGVDWRGVVHCLTTA